jgi:glucose-1-phosphate thymidylyltransferase
MSVKPSSIAGKEIIGLLPAGGYAARIAPIPCSKEIFPIGFHPPLSPIGSRPKAAAHYLIDKMRSAGAQKAYFILRDGKWDIPAYFGDGAFAGLPLGYLMMSLPYGVPFTLDQAYPFVGEATILLGFPDILFQPGDAFERLLKRQTATDADLVLGLFLAHQPHKMDMVDIDPSGRIRQITIKPAQTTLSYTWIIAVWSGRFNRYLHEFVGIRKEDFAKEPRPTELYLGEVFQAAIRQGLHIDHVVFQDGSYIDIGTPDDLSAAYYNPI